MPVMTGQDLEGAKRGRPQGPGHRAPAGSRFNGWIVDVILGGAIGGLLGAIVAVNLVIYSGIEDGYEANLVDVFQQSPWIGLLTVAALIAGPTVGVTVARRRRAAGSGRDG